MTLPSEFQNAIDELRNVLAERLEYSVRWDNVKLKVRRTYVEVTWFGSKEYDDPLGSVFFETRRVSPLTMKSLIGFIERQKKNLERDKKNAESVLGRGDNL